MSAKYTFDTYLEFDCNALAKNSSEIVVLDSESRYNPLFLYGYHGVGKTHLLYAIQKQAKINNKEVVYLDGEWFVKNFVNGIRYGTMKEFRNKYRNTDFFLVDNIEKIIGRKSSQQELLSTIEVLLCLRKQVVITSSKCPNDIKCWDERLRSRLNMGLVIHIEDYSVKEKTQIIVSMANRMGLNIYLDFAAILLNELYGDLEMINSYFEHTIALKEEVTFNHIKMFKNEDTESIRNKIDCQAIIDVTAKYYDVEVDLIKWKNRNKEILIHRQVAMYLCSEMTEESLTVIGNFFNRNPSTVRTAKDKISELKKKNEEINKAVEMIRRYVNNNERRINKIN